MSELPVKLSNIISMCWEPKEMTPAAQSWSVSSHYFPREQKLELDFATCAGFGRASADLQGRNCNESDPKNQFQFLIGLKMLACTKRFFYSFGFFFFYILLTISSSCKSADFSSKSLLLLPPPWLPLLLLLPQLFFLELEGRPTTPPGSLPWPGSSLSSHPVHPLPRLCLFHEVKDPRADSSSS